MKKLAMFLGVLALMVVFSASQVEAVPILKLSDGTTTVIVNDNSSKDFRTEWGVIGWSGSIGKFNVIVTVGITKPELGSANYPWMELNNINISGGAGTLTIEFTDTTFYLPDQYPGFITGIGGTTGGTVKLDVYLDESNTPFGTGTLLASLGPYSGPTFSGTSTIDINPNEPFSLTQVATVTHGSGTVSSSFDADTYPTPEPSSLLLLGSGLLGFGAFFRARFGRKKKD